MKGTPRTSMREIRRVDRPTPRQWESSKKEVEEEEDGVGCACVCGMEGEKEEEASTPTPLDVCARARYCAVSSCCRSDSRHFWVVLCLQSGPVPNGTVLCCPVPCRRLLCLLVPRRLLLAVYVPVCSACACDCVSNREQPFALRAADL